MKDNQAKYPQLRFKGFTDPWEQRKLGKMGYTFTGLSGKTKEDFGHGNAKFVTYMNVFSSPVSNSEMVENVEVDSKQHQVEYGDVFFTTSSETPQEVGMSSVWLETAENIYLNSFCFGYHPMVEFDPYYLAFMLRSPVIRKKFMLLAQGISRYNISKNKVMEMLVPVPEIVEQQKIGSFFKQLDDTITLHQRKLAKLKELKQGYLQKLFPKNGSKFPQLRFAGFADAWEQRKLSEIYDKIRNAFVGTATPYYVNQGHFYLESNNVKYGKLNFNNEVYINDDFYQKQKPNWLHTGDLVVVQSGHVGHSAVIPSELNNTAAHAVIIVAKPKQKIDPYFINDYLQTNIARKQIDNITTGNTIKHILASAMKIFEVSLPSYEEQRPISNLLAQIDDTITLHQSKLKKLQELKKGYLQKMFC
ncbi:restriction endonuclease subunit S [Lacticaseibacillus paracasei]|uniref:EcoKI restriction-modification system protein HsdS n=1 Tax=Lacticaseibacillus paracasei TaxID=1597 RepID=A0A8B3H1V4_LACPA|nr:restriction endonuclease subunit S [Lacticaseibacillus paracasei]RNE33565.1 EcoKI restriction-modification system protein HsdS [Lacticaseibacillus paracasei]